MKNSVIILLLLLPFITFAQQQDHFPIFEEGNIAGLKIERTEYYNGNSLWGLINGGADIYLEYGFDKLAFQSVDWKGENFRVEIYRMQNENGAFGIFSVNRYKCDINDTLTKYICITPYQVQAAVGKYYISVANNSGTNDAMILTIQLFENILSKTDEAEIKLPPLFNNDYFTPFNDKLKFIVGELGLQNGFPMWYDMFADYSGYEFFVIPVSHGEKRSYISEIKFADEVAARKFLDENGNSENVTFKIISPKEIIFVKSDSLDTELKKILDLYN